MIAFNQTKAIAYILAFISLIVNCNRQGPGETVNPAILLLLNQPATNNPTVSCPLSPKREEFADTVVQAVSSAEAFGNPALSTNGVCGGGTNSGSLDVFSLSKVGQGSSLVLRWSGKTILNGVGIDFVVFENPWVIGSNSNSVFLEPIIVEVSRDNSNYCGFNPTYSGGTTYSRNPSDWQNFAGKTPVLYNDATNRLDTESLFNPALAGGDGFDLDLLSDSNSAGTGCSTNIRADIVQNGFLFLRLIAATARMNPGTGQPYPSDGAASNGPDIDGVAARYRQ